MISGFIITVSLLLAGAFLLAWFAGPELRRRIERPKHLFAEQVQQYDAQCQQEAAPAGGPGDEEEDRAASGSDQGPSA